MTTSATAASNHLNPLHEVTCRLGLRGWLNPNTWAEHLDASGVKCCGTDVTKLLKLGTVAQTDNMPSALGIYKRTGRGREAFYQILRPGTPRDNSTWQQEVPPVRADVLPDDLRDRAAAFVASESALRHLRSAKVRARERARTPPPLPNTTTAAAPAAAPPSNADGVDALPQLDAAAPAITRAALERDPKRQKLELRKSIDWLPGVSVEPWIVGRPQDDSSSRTFLLLGSDALTPVVTVSARPQQGSPLVDVEVRVHRLQWDPHTKRWAHGPVPARAKNEESFIRLLVDLRAVNFCPGVTKGDFPEARHEAFDEKLAQGVRRYALDIASGAAGPGVLGCRPGVGGCQDGAYVLEPLGGVVAGAFAGPRLVSPDCRLLDYCDDFQKRSHDRLAICAACYPIVENVRRVVARPTSTAGGVTARIDWAVLSGPDAVRPMVVDARRAERAAKKRAARAQRRLEESEMLGGAEFGELVDALKKTEAYARDYPEGTSRRALMDS